MEFWSQGKTKISWGKPEVDQKTFLKQHRPFASSFRIWHKSYDHTRLRFHRLFTFFNFFSMKGLFRWFSFSSEFQTLFGENKMRVLCDFSCQNSNIFIDEVAAFEVSAVVKSLIMNHHFWSYKLHLTSKENFNAKVRIQFYILYVTYTVTVVLESEALHAWKVPNYPSLSINYSIVLGRSSSHFYFTRELKKWVFNLEFKIFKPYSKR